MLPSSVQGPIHGHAIASLANSPFTFNTVEFFDGLDVEPGVVITDVGPNSNTPTFSVHGTLTIGAGATIRCDNTALHYSFIGVDGTTVLNGTSSAPVRIESSPPAPYYGACLAHFGTATFRYAHLSSIPAYFGVGSVVRDSTFDAFSQQPSPAGRRSNSVFAHDGGTSADVLFEFNDFHSVALQGHAFTAQHNLFEGNGRPLKACTECIANRACMGALDLSANITATDNAFLRSDAGNPNVDELILIERDYGPINLSGNWFEHLASAELLESGTSGAGSCGTGQPPAYGGPLTVTPTLSTRPQVGPR